MQKVLFIKIVVVLLLAVVVLIPLEMVRNLVYERMGRHNEVAANIAKSYAEPQRIANPVLVLPFNVEYSAEEKRHSVSSALFVLPREVAGSGNIATDVKRRGLFRVPVYTLDSVWKGRFELPSQPEVAHWGANQKVTWGKPYLSLAVSDPRGLAGTPKLSLNGTPLKVTQGSGIDFMPAGVHANLGDGMVEGGRSLEFTLDLRLRGTSGLSVFPLADSLTLELASNWQHPGFEGRFLPDPETQQVGDQGFRARWQVSALATDAAERLKQRCAGGACLDAFAVNLREPVNIYSQSERALKYGFLLVFVSFAAFFFFEILKKLAIHPAQYTLIGLALAMFFLLLLSLSEHIEFVYAYAAAASACVVLIGVYLGAVMRGAFRALGFSALLAAFYAALYGLLASEDNALLMGSLLLFVLLATAMLATRRVDWYRVGQE